MLNLATTTSSIRTSTMVISLLLLSPGTSPSNSSTSLLDNSWCHHQCLGCREVLNITMDISTPTTRLYQYSIITQVQ